MKYFITSIIASLIISPLLVAQQPGAMPLLIPYREGNAWGYCDSTKKIIVKPQFDAPVFIDQFAFVSINNKKGIIDNKGILLVKCEFDVANFTYNKKNSLVLYVRKGKDYLQYIQETKTLEPYVFPYRAPEDTTGEVIEEIMEDMAYYPADSNISITSSHKNQYDVAIKKVIPYTSKLIRIDSLRIIASSVRSIPMTDTLFFIQRNKKWGVISFAKKIVVPVVFDSIYGIWGGLAFGVQKGKKHGIIMPSRSLASPIIYDDVRNNDGAEGFLVKINNKWGVLLEDLKTRVMIDAELYRKYTTLSYLKLIGITDQNGRFLGYVDFKGKKYWQ